MGAGEHGASRWLTMAAFAMLAVPLGGCDLPPCESLDLGATQDRSADADLPKAMLAVGNQGYIRVVRECDSEQSCEENQLEFDWQYEAKPSQSQQSMAAFSATGATEPGPTSIEQLMLTASGRWLIYRAGREVGTSNIDGCIDDDACKWGHRELDISELIGTLRGGDWIIYRTEGGRLRANYVGDDDLFEEDRERDFAIGSDAELLVGALGYRHVVARKPRGDGTEELYLIRIAPALKVDELGSTMIGELRLLAVGPAFRRILITEGPSPAERDDPKEFQHDVPTDVQVIATSGEGPSARTLIYDVSDLTQIANFAGEVVTKHAVLEDVAGLSAVSPDGTHLAYITSDGGLALRNLETQRSCLVRSSNSATHLLAGFAKDATLYFESEEEAYARDDNSGFALQTVENIHAYDPSAETFAALTAPTDLAKVWRLRAVPPEREEGEPPWAVAGHDGDYIVKPGATPKSLDYDEAQFLPHSNGASELWVVEALESRLEVRSLSSKTKLFTHASNTTVCLSNSPSATPWATNCSPADDPEQYLDNGLPDPEQGL